MKAKQVFFFVWPDKLIFLTYYLTGFAEFFYTLTYEIIKVVHLHGYPFPAHLDILEQHSLSASLKIPTKVIVLRVALSILLFLSVTGKQSRT